MAATKPSNPPSAAPKKGAGPKLEPERQASFLRYLASREWWISITLLVLLAVGVVSGVFYVLLPWITQKGQTVEVPDVRGLTFEKAEDLLGDNQLRHTVVDSQYDPGVPPLTVLSQDPPKGAIVKPYRRIFITLNPHNPPGVRLPNVVNLTLSEAKYQLASWKLKVGQVTRVPGQERNRVRKVLFEGQVLNKGDQLPAGSTVDLVVVEGMSQGLVSLPDLVGLKWEVAIERLQQAGLTPIQPEFRPNEDEEEGTVYRMTPSPETLDSVPAGTDVLMIVAGERPDNVMEVMSSTQREATEDAVEALQDEDDALDDLDEE